MFHKKYSHGVLIIIVLISMVSGFLGGALMVNLMGSGMTLTENGQPPQKTIEKRIIIEESGVIDAVKKVSPAVVSIVVTKDLPLYRQGSFNFDDFFFNSDPFSGFPFLQPNYNDNDGGGEHALRKVGGGSGFIVTEDGLILTNRHVVEDAEADYTVVLNDGAEYSAEVVSRDPLNDIAVVKIKDGDGNSLKGLPVVDLGNSSDLQVGQRVVAIGNALAEYENTVTAGVISAKGRDIVAGGMGSAENLINLLQTDAAINPGNSGGPLVDLNGNVIGINTAVANGAQGIGFAIPIDDIKPLIDSVKKNGKIVRPFLGVRYILLDEKRADELKIDISYGALLVGDEAKGEFAVIPGSPADKAGLQIKDVILKVNDKKVTVDSPLQTLVAKNVPGDTLILTVWRGGDELKLKATLSEAK